MSEKDKYPSEMAERFQVRLPVGLRDRIKEKAEANGRSMNTEIVDCIETALAAPDLSVTQLRELLDKESSAARMMQSVIDNQMMVLSDLREILRSYRQQNYQQAGMIESLSSILISLEPEPHPEIIALARKLHDTATAHRQTYSNLSDEEF